MIVAAGNVGQPSVRQPFQADSMTNVRLESLTYFGRRLSFLLRSSTVSNARCDGNRDSSSSSALSNDWQSSKYGFTPKQIGGNQGQSKPAINGLAAGGSGYIVASSLCPKPRFGKRGRFPLGR